MGLSIDKDKVIKILEKAKTVIENWVPMFEQYNTPAGIDDAIALLKEQEAVEPINSYGTFRCGNCRNIVGYNDGYGHGYQNNFCSKCGKAVKWDARRRISMDNE